MQADNARSAWYVIYLSTDAVGAGRQMVPWLFGSVLADKSIYRTEDRSTRKIRMLCPCAEDLGVACFGY